MNKREMEKQIGRLLNVHYACIKARVDSDAEKNLRAERERLVQELIATLSDPPKARTGLTEKEAKQLIDEYWGAVRGQFRDELSGVMRGNAQVKATYDALSDALTTEDKPAPKPMVLSNDELAKTLWRFHDNNDRHIQEVARRSIIAHDERLRELLRWMCYAEDARITDEIEQIIQGQD